jgi:hypothetical protein
MPSLLEDTPSPQTDSSLFGITDGVGEALGHLYSRVKHTLAPETPPLWPLDSPVGTSRVGGDTSVGMPDPNVSLALDTSWGGSRPPLASEWNAMERGTKTVGGTLMAAEMPDLGPGPSSSVALASRRVRPPGSPPPPPRPAGTVEAPSSEGLLGIRAYHGSPYDFNAFDTSKIGTGEGAQAFGHGHYAAEAESTARYYRDTLSKWTDNVAQHVNDITGVDISEDYLPAIRQIAMGSGAGVGSATTALKARVPELRDIDGSSMIGPHPTLEKLITAIRSDQNKGHMYELNIRAEPEHMLDWDQTIGTHPPEIRDKLYDMGYGATQRGKDVYMHMSRGKEGDAGASAKLRDAGIPGIKYLDQGSRAAGEGTSNYVVFDPATIEILRKYGIAGLIAGGGAAAATGGQEQNQ